MNFKPMSDRVLVEKVEAPKETAGGILLPDNNQEAPAEGKVVAVGDGKLTEAGNPIKLTVEEGNTVVFGKYAGTPVEVEGKEYIVMREEDILGVLQ